MSSPGSPVDLNFYKLQVVRVYNPSGTFLGSWPDAPLLSGFKEAVNSATQPLRLQLPRKFDDFDLAGVPSSLYGTVGLGNIVQFYLVGPGLSTAGLLRYQGVIDKYEPSIGADGAEAVTITITPQSSVLGDESITNTVVFGVPGTTYVDPITMFTYFFSNNDPISGHPFAYPLTQDGSNPASTGVTKQYTFANQSLGSIWQTAAQLAGANWFFRVNADNSVTFNQPPSSAQHLFNIGQHCTTPTYSKDVTGLKNIIHVIGNTRQSVKLTTALTSGNVYTTLAVKALPIKMVSGQTLLLGGAQGNPTQQVSLAANANAGATSVTVTSFTAAANFPVDTPVDLVFEAIVHGSDIATYGPRVLTVSDSRITDQTTATALANWLLATYDQPVYRMQMRVLDYRGDVSTGLGYDIESIHVGDTCQILNQQQPTSASSSWDSALWDTATWDVTAGADLTQVAVITGLSYGYDFVDLEIGQLAPNQDVALARLIQQFTITTSI